MDRQKLKLRIREWDSQQWLDEVMQKSTLQWYKEANSISDTMSAIGIM